MKHFFNIHFFMYIFLRKTEIYHQIQCLSITIRSNNIQRKKNVLKHFHTTQIFHKPKHTEGNIIITRKKCWFLCLWFTRSCCPFFLSLSLSLSCFSYSFSSNFPHIIIKKSFPIHISLISNKKGIQKHIQQKEDVMEVYDGSVKTQ